MSCDDDLKEMWDEPEYLVLEGSTLRYLGEAPEGSPSEVGDNWCTEEIAKKPVQLAWR